MRLLVVIAVLAAALVAGAAVLVLGVGGGGTTAGEPRPVDGAVDTHGLPEPVAATRAQLLEAAEAGDPDRLAALAGDDFSYSFGGPVEGGPAAFWRAEEERGGRPLEALAAILRLPYALANGLYVWPFAHAVDPRAIGEYERGLLDDIPGGAPVDDAGYRGWRVGIAPDGTWQFFIAGD